METSYFDYYHHCMQHHRIGLKLVLGGTGLGKTSSIEDVITAPEYHNRKFIYCANRKELLDGMARSLDKKHHSDLYVVLRRDLEVVLDTLDKHRSAFYDLLSHTTFLDMVSRWNDRHRLHPVDVAAVRRACKTLEEMPSGGPLPKLIEEQMDDQARLVLAAFRSAILAAYNKNGKPLAAYSSLIKHPVVQSLFPCIAFKQRPEVRIMLVTLQKAFYGFFDGEQILNLTKLQDDNGGYVIFLDEFDFLENDLIELICRSPQISNPFRFVALFYNAMKWHKLPLEDYPLSNNIRNQIEEIKKIIDDLQDVFKDEELTFPDINQFTWSPSQKIGTWSGKGIQDTKRVPAIFRTRHTISTNPLRLHITNRSFEISSEPSVQGRTYSALRLFDAVSYASELILMLFKDLEKKNEDILYREILRHCYQDTVFPEQMALISQFARSSQGWQDTELDELLDTGYSLYDIIDLQQRTDREEVDVRHYGIYLTPEMILRSLAQHNLVFALSATADIERHLHHFNLRWLRQQVNMIEVDDIDREIIRERNSLKASRRNNHVSTVVLDDLDRNDSYQQALDQFLCAVALDEDFGQDTSTGHLKRRVQQFFATLLWMQAHPKKDDTLLLFLNTFKQIKLVFDRYHTQDEHLFEVSKLTGNRWFDVYELTLQGWQFTVIFYNAQMAKAVRQSPEAQRTFDALFWQEKPVVVVTQYLSAGNGVNLQYKPFEGSKDDQDFTHIGLLEAPYFYFSKPDEDLPQDEQLAALKQNIWYQAKLYTSKVITAQRFRDVLSTLNASSEWNRRYLFDRTTAADALFNHMATFMQALGRVERVWTQMPDQTVLLSRDVYHRFQSFCSPEYEELRVEREPIISNNLQQVFAQISASLPHVERAVQRSKDARLEAKNERCKSSIQRLLARLEGLRQGSGDHTARRHWQHLRQAALKHQFEDALLHEYECTAASSYYMNGVLYLTPQNEIVPARLAQPDTYHWRMNAIYNVIERNAVVREYFLQHGYKLAFGHMSQQFFTPYCYQAILTGAIGEEAITALLMYEDIHFEELADTLFEIADLKIQGRPYYFDCKNYSDLTMERFAIPMGDPAWHPKLNDEHFQQSACVKVEKISSHHGTAGKLIYLNLVTSQDRPLSYYDRDFHQVNTFAEASIVVVQGALQRYAPNAYYQAFEYFLHDLISDYKGENHATHRSNDNTDRQETDQL